MNQRIPMTVDGAASLQNELHQLKTLDRPQAISDIAEARAHGDLKENAEYHAAREKQSITENRIKEIENKLYNAQVIDITKITNRGKVIFGSTVTLYNFDKKEKSIYKIVGEDEADVKKNKISIISPIARALISKIKGENIRVQTPQGSVKYQIIEVKYIN